MAYEVLELTVLRLRPKDTYRKWIRDCPKWIRSRDCQREVKQGLAVNHKTLKKEWRKENT